LAEDEYGNVITDSTTGVDWTDPVVRGVFDETEVGEYDVQAELDGVTSNVITVIVEEEDTDSTDTELEDDTIYIDTEYTAKASIGIEE